MIGSDAAFSLPCCGSSMAILTVPLLCRPPLAAPLPVRVVPPVAAARRERQDGDAGERANLA